MYSVVKSRVQVGSEKKLTNLNVYWECGKENVCRLFLFAMYLNDIKNTFRSNKFEGMNMSLARMLMQMMQ